MKKILNILATMAIVAVVAFVGHLFGLDPLYTALGFTVISLIVGQRFNIAGALFLTPVPRGWDNRPRDNTERVATRGFQDAIAYAASVTLTPKLLNREYFKFAQLTGAITINITTTGLLDFDEIVIQVGTDGTQRIVTLGAAFLSAGTLTVPAGKYATVSGYYDKTLDKVIITGREITA